MIKTSDIKRKDVLEEMQRLAGPHLLHSGPLAGLQKELNRDYISPSYLREKIGLVKRTMDALEHDLQILEMDTIENKQE